MINKGIDLAADETPARRAIALFMALFTGFVGLFFTAGPVTFANSWEDFGSRFDETNKPPEISPLVLAMPVGIGVLMMAFSVVLTLRVFRSAAWLDGTTAYVRGAFRTNSIDLSTAYVSVGAGGRRAGSAHVVRTSAGAVGHVAVWEVPTLEAQDPGSGRKLTIELCRPSGAVIPPYALRALAEAMVRGRGWNGNDQDVHNLAQRLRALADENSFTPNRPSVTPGIPPAAEQPTASDPWLSSSPGYGDGRLPDSPGYGDGPQAGASARTDAWGSDGATREYTDSSPYEGTPDPMRRKSNTGLLVTVGGLTILLAGGLSAAGLVYLDKVGKADRAADSAASAGGAGKGTESTNDSAGEDQPDGKPLPSGTAALVTAGENQVRIKIDKIKTHSGGCGSVGFPPDAGYYITARVTYQVVKGNAEVNSLGFSYVDDSGRSYRQVPAGFSGCGGDQTLDLGGSRPAGSKGTGFISFDGPARGTIVFAAQGRQYAWKVG